MEAVGQDLAEVFVLHQVVGAEELGRTPEMLRHTPVQIFGTPGLLSTALEQPRDLGDRGQNHHY